MTKGQEWWRHPDRRFREQISGSLQKAKAYSDGVIIPFDERPEDEGDELCAVEVPQVRKGKLHQE